MITRTRLGPVFAFALTLVDADSLCTDFLLQVASTLPVASAAGATTIKVAGVAGFGQARRS